MAQLYIENSMQFQSPPALGSQEKSFGKTTAWKPARKKKGWNWDDKKGGKEEEPPYLLLMKGRREEG